MGYGRNMKFCAYNVSSDEKPYFERVGRELGVEYVLVEEQMNDENARMAEGCDGVLDFLQDVGYTDKEMATFAGFGIKYMSLRSAGFDMDGLEFLKK